jgi:hypothetical protein
MNLKPAQRINPVKIRATEAPKNAHRIRFRHPTITCHAGCILTTHEHKPSKSIAHLPRQRVLILTLQEWFLRFIISKIRQSLRVVWLLEELGIEYDLKLYKRDPVRLLAPPELKAISPLGTSPSFRMMMVTLCCARRMQSLITFLTYVLQTPRLSTASLQLRPAAGTPERNDYLFFFHGGQAEFGDEYEWRLHLECHRN